MKQELTQAEVPVRDRKVKIPTSFIPKQDPLTELLARIERETAKPGCLALSLTMDEVLLVRDTFYDLRAK